MLPEDGLILSGDGSHTLRSKKFNVTYHSTHGAITESTVIFIQSGLDYFASSNAQSPIRVFEMGFGTGLNALLTAIWASVHHRSIQYYTVEAFPIGEETYSLLNFGQLAGAQHLFTSLHAQRWNEWATVTPEFKLCKCHGKLEDTEPEGRYDVIYYDAFGPGAQPHLWELPVLQKMYDLTADGGVLTSFCVQGAFRRNLIAASYKVEKLPGPPGKREITRAIKL